jgi:hypothetical protein
MKDNCLTEELIARYADGLASKAEQKQIMDHCRNCKDCTNELISIMQFLNQNAEFILPFEKTVAEESELRVELAAEPMDMVAMNMSLRVASMDNLHDFTEGKLLHKEIIKKIYLSSSKDTCAIRAQKIILNDFNIHVSDKHLINEAIENAWYVPGKGTLLSDTGKLLELHGIRIEIKINVTITEVLQELHNGNKIIVGVDSGELWATTPDEILSEKLEDEENLIPDHVLVVLDIKQTEQIEKSVTVKDTTFSQTVTQYPLEKFLDAWQDSNFFMVVAHKPQ